jgi:hypothetical protein
MKLGMHNSAKESRLSHQLRVKDRAVLIRNTANALGITAIDIEPSNLLKDTFRIEFDDCTGRKQTLFMPVGATSARVSETLRFVSGRRPKAG